MDTDRVVRGVERELSDERQQQQQQEQQQLSSRQLLTDARNETNLSFIAAIATASAARRLPYFMHLNIALHCFNIATSGG